MERRDLFDELKGELKKIERKKRGEATPGVRKISESNNLFTLDFYLQLKMLRENLFFSPFSVYTALAMVFVGARGLTAKQMSENLYVSMEQNQFHSMLESLLGTFRDNRVSKGFELHIANLLAFRKGYKILDEYITFIKKKYDGNIWELVGDFSVRINSWVSEQTQGKITKIFDSQSISPEITLILINTIYFKGEWHYKFMKSATEEDTFSLIDSNKVFIPMMHQINLFGYFESENIQILEMTYKGSEEHLSMVIFLPKELDGLIEFENKITNEQVSSYITQLYARRVEVFIPRFKFEKEYSLIDSLKNLGMINPFTLDADFSGITDSPEGLFIEKVIHKAFIDVDEEGTEAAASTVIMMAPTGPPIKREPPPIFRADHPFLFIIRDMQTNTILFIGRVMNP